MNDAEHAGVAFVALAALVGGYLIVQGLAAWRERLARPDRPRSPFAELARAHALTAAQRRVCRDVAREKDYAEPGEVFVRLPAAEAIAQREPALAKRLFREG